VIRCTALTTLLVVTAFGPASADAMVVSARPAWDGWLRADQATEVTVRVASEVGGQLRLELRDRSVVYRNNTLLEPDAQYVWRVPLSPPSGQPLRLSAQLGRQQKVAVEIPLRLYQAPLPLVAVLSGEPIVWESDRVTALHVANDAAPYHASSYDAMDITVIHRDALQGMTRQQLLALRGHAAKCGRMVVVGFTPTAVASFHELAGCNGRFLVAAPSSTQLDGALETLLTEPPMSLPSPGNLRTLFDDEVWNRPVRSVGWFLALYILVLLLALRSRYASRFLVGASMAAALIAWLTWSLGSETVERVTWAETANLSDMARFVSLVRVRGIGGRVTLDSSLDAGPLQPLQATELHVDSGLASDGASRVSFDSRLLSTHEFVAFGVSAWPAPISVEWREDTPRIINHRPEPSPPGVLAWRDRKYSVPSLGPGEEWWPTADPEPWETAGAEQIFRHRAMNEVMALLFESPGQPGFAADARSSYLMVRP